MKNVQQSNISTNAFFSWIKYMLFLYVTREKRRLPKYCIVVRTACIIAHLTLCYSFFCPLYSLFSIFWSLTSSLLQNHQKEFLFCLSEASLTWTIQSLDLIIYDLFVAVISTTLHNSRRKFEKAQTAARSLL